MEQPADLTQARISELISNLMTAISTCSLYSDKHPVVKEYAGRVVDILSGMFVGDTLTITVLGDSIIANDTPCVEKGVHLSNFARRVRRKKIDKIIFKKTPDEEEIAVFVAGMASRDKIVSTPRVSVGIVEIKLKNDALSAGDLLDSGIVKVKESFMEMFAMKQIDMVGLEDAVIDFLATIKKELNVLRVVSPVKSHNEYTYVHATNVSVLTIFQAESFGIEGDTLRDIGLAGLLHDTGKLFVANQVLDKQGKLEPEEWEEMKRHPLLGALYLSKLPEVPELASIVAFEHHMKYDGSGYPDTKRAGRNQHVVSQMVAISDFFDALRTERPYRKPLEVPAIIRMLKEGAGREFNPELVDSFLYNLSEVSGGSFE